MTNSEAIREFAESKFDHLINEAIKKLAEKYLPIKGYEFAIDKYALLKVKEHDDFLSDLTSLISEHYVSKDEHEKMKHNLTHCGSCGDPLSRDCPRCKHLWET